MGYVPPGQRRQSPPLGRSHPLNPDRLGEDALDHERVDEHHAVLQQVEAQHGRFLVFDTVGGDPAAGKAFLDMLGVFAEFETNLRRERQLEGIRAAKERGVYKGRRHGIDAAEVRRLREQEKLGPAAIARRLGIGRASVYRVLGKQLPPA